MHVQQRRIRRSPLRWSKGQEHQGSVPQGDCYGRLLHTLGGAAAVDAAAVPRKVDKCTVLSATVNQEAIDRIVTDTEWINDDGMDALSQLVHHCSGRASDCILLGPYPTATIWQIAEEEEKFQQQLSTDAGSADAAKGAVVICDSSSEDCCLEDGGGTADAGAGAASGRDSDSEDSMQIIGERRSSYSADRKCLTKAAAAMAPTAANRVLTTVGVVNVSKTHWLAFSTLLHSSGVQLVFYEPMSQTTGRGSYNGTFNGSTTTELPLDVYSPKYPGAKLVALLDWHCRAWQCQAGTRVSLNIVHTAQQTSDGWTCGRWAIDNLAALLDNPTSPVLSRKFIDVRQRVMRLVKALAVPKYRQHFPEQSGNRA